MPRLFCEFYRSDHVTIDLQRHMHFVTAQRILAVRRTIRPLERAKIPRLAIVVENDGLVQLL